MNLTAFLVGADGRVRSDADMVFFQVDVATFGADGVPPRLTYGRDWVKHLGDVTADGPGMKRETIEHRLLPPQAGGIPRRDRC